MSSESTPIPNESPHSPPAPIPENWSAAPLKYVTRINPDSINGDEPGDWEIEYVDISSVNNRGDISGTSQFSFDEAPSRAQRLVEDGDTIISTVRTYLKAIAFIENAPDNLVVSTGFGVLRPDESIHPPFLSKVLRADPFVDWIVANSEGVSYPAINPSRLGQLVIPVPPVEEQKSICTFLDREVGYINELIDEHQSLNNLLDEKEMSLITNYVTRGIADNEMKDADLPWVGKIPANWDIVPLKYVANVRTGIAKGRDRSGESTRSVPYLRVANVQDGYLDLSEVKELELTEAEINQYSLQKGDVLMNEGGDYDKLGRGTVWNGEIDPCVHQNHVFCVRPQNVKHSGWISTLSRSKYLKHYFMMNAKQTTNLASISASNIASAPLIWPPKEKRDKILDTIDETTTLIGELKNSIEESIDILKEKRRALMTMAVTGQIDVTESRGGKQEISS